MIYDTLNNLPNYLGLCSSLDSVIEFIMARDINNLPAGRTRIDGDKAVVMVSTVTPQASDKAPFVRHDNHPIILKSRVGFRSQARLSSVGHDTRVTCLTPT